MVRETARKGRRIGRMGRKGMWPSSPVLSVQLFVLLIFILSSPPFANSAVFDVPAGDAGALTAAINTANGNGEADTINLGGGTYSLSTPISTPFGAAGIIINSEITINGNGSTIERSLENIPDFSVIFVDSDGNLTLNEVTIRNGSAVQGGGIFNNGTINIKDSTISGNVATEDGGGIFNQGMVENITNSIISNNGFVVDDSLVFIITQQGGGIFNNGTININDSTISDNFALFEGGGIENTGEMTITNSTLSRNQTDFEGDSGGGIGSIGETANINITNSTISGNNGGGISNFIGSTININNVTITDNNGGSGFFTELSDTVDIANTIIAQNNSGDCSGDFNSLGFNLIGNNQDCNGFDETGDLVGVESMLGPLQNNGGPTETHALLPGSAAIDAGNPDPPAENSPPLCETTDQRGVTRPQGPRCDIGAFELAGLTISKFSSTTSVPPFGEITYTITVQNNDIIEATSLTVQDPLPSGAEFVSASDSCTEEEGVVTCSLGPIPAGESTILTITIAITECTTNIENTANLISSGETIGSSTFVTTCGQVPCNPDLGGRFNGNVTFNRSNPPFPEDMQAIDPTTLDVVVESESSANGTIDAPWLTDVAITGDCSGNTFAFSGTFKEMMGVKCDGTINGTITFDPITNSVEVEGMGDDCKSPYAFTGTLAGPGAGGDGGSGSSGGCSIAQGGNSTTPLSMLVYLLIPSLILIRRGWKRIVSLRQQLIGSRGINLTTFLLLSGAVSGFILIIPSSAQAQSLIKACGNRNVQAAASLDILCSELASMESDLTPDQQELLDFCTELIEATGGSSEPNDEVCDAIEETARDTISVLYTNVLRLQANKQFKTIRTRIAQLRNGTASLKGFAYNIKGQPLSDNSLVASVSPFAIAYQVPADESSPFGKLGLFVNSSFNFGDKDQTSASTGFDFLIFDITGGIDYKFTENFILGLSFTYTRTDIDLDSSLGDLNTNGYTGSIYASFYPLDQLYIDGIAILGWIDYDLKRNIVIPAFGINQTNSGDTDGFYYSLAIGLGYNFNIGGFTIGPLGRFNYSHADIDSYSEETNGDDGLALQFDDQDAQSLTTALGAQMSYTISTTFGVLVPQGIFEWVHEYKAEDTASANFLAGAGLENNPSFKIQADDPDKDTFNLGGGLSAVFPYGISAFVYYEAVLGWDDFSSHYISAGLRKEL